MPITQDRMIAVVREAFAMKVYAEGLRDDISNALRTSRDSDPNMTIAMIEGAILLRKEPDVSSIMLEARHYQVNSRKNEKSKERARLLRRTAGQREAPTAPKSLISSFVEPDVMKGLQEEYERFNKGEKKGPKAEGGKDPLDEKDILSGL